MKLGYYMVLQLLSFSYSEAKIRSGGLHNLPLCSHYGIISVPVNSPLKEPNPWAGFAFGSEV
jgi:hypothetical protein